MMLGARIGLAVVMCLVMVSSPGSNLAARAAGCSWLGNLYAVNDATLLGCGYRIFPLERVDARADGGQDYVYTLDGREITRPVPPPWINFATATDQERAAYNIPPHPVNPAQVPAWTAQVSTLHFLQPPDKLVGVPGKAADSNSHVWSGYEATASYNRYTDAYMDYNEPYQISGGCSGEQLLVWAGLGGVGTVPLGQTGTAPYTNGAMPNHEIWTEVLPDDPYYVDEGASIPAGHDARVETIRDSPDNQYYFYMTDATANWTIEVIESSTHYNGYDADFIAERPTWSGSAVPLRQWYWGSTNNLYVNAAQANGGSGRYGVQTFPNSRVIMQSNATGNILATPSGLSGQSFTDVWQKCG